jgi:prepilin-type processing-associated H-X9-DG protein
LPEPATGLEVSLRLAARRPTDRSGLPELARGPDPRGGADGLRLGRREPDQLVPVVRWPPTLAQGDDDRWWTTHPTARLHNDPNRFNGIIYTHSTTRIADVTRGTTHTVLLGEKYLPTDRYTTGDDPGDNESMYTGFNNDISRSTFNPPLQDRPFSQVQPVLHAHRFGSPHPGGFNVVLADGSVRLVSYLVNLDVFRAYGHRTSPVVGGLD